MLIILIIIAVVFKAHDDINHDIDNGLTKIITFKGQSFASPFSSLLSVIELLDLTAKFSNVPSLIILIST